MPVCSKSMISKELYMRFVGVSHPAVREQFMERGGWHLLFGWANQAIATKNYELLKGILKLLMVTPPTSINRLKSNRFIIIFKSFLLECNDKELTSLVNVVLSSWRKFARAEQIKRECMCFEHRPQQGTPVKEFEVFGGEIGGPAAALPTADFGEGNRGSLIVEGTQISLGPGKEERKEGVAPEGKPMARKVVQKQDLPLRAPDFRSSKVPPLIPVEKLRVAIPRECTVAVLSKKSCYSDKSSSLQEKMKSSLSLSSGDIGSVSKGTVDVQDKLEKRGKKKVDKKKRPKQKSDQIKEESKKLAWMPTPASSSSNVSHSVSAAMPPKIERKRKESKDLEEKPGAAKKMKAGTTVVMDQTSAGGSQAIKKVAKSYLTAKDQFNGPKKNESGKGQPQNFEGNSAETGFRRGSNSFTGNKMKSDLNRICSNGLLRKKKRCEITCRFFKKGHCSYGTRCKYLHAASVSISTPANDQSGKSFASRQSTGHRNGTSGNRKKNHRNSTSNVKPFKEDWDFGNGTRSARSPLENEKPIPKKVKDQPKA